MDNRPTRTFRARDAATGKEVAPDFVITSIAEVSTLCRAAEAAFDAYRAVPHERRADFLEAIGSEILALGDALLDRAALETGLPPMRLVGERRRTIDQLGLFADTLRKSQGDGVRVDAALPDREPQPRPDLRVRYIPLGPVAVFGASNFPLAFSTAGGDTASALAAGCPVVVKGHPAHPGTGALVAEAIGRAATATGMPAGVFGHICGPGDALGKALVSDPRIAAVGFTGSRRGGLALIEIAQNRALPIPVYAEMSSINPVVLLPGALASRASQLGAEFVASLTLGAGQFCTNPGLVIGIASKGLDAFERAAAEAMAAHVPQTMLTTEICGAFAADCSKLSKIPGTLEIARGIPGNGMTSETPRLFAIDAANVKRHPELLSEIFGAGGLVVRCKSFDDVAQLLKDIEGQLTATIHMDPMDCINAARLLPILERKAGRILVNGWPTGVEVTHAMVHGGPFPATYDGQSTSVGTLAIDRFLRPVCYQNFPISLLPHELQANLAASLSPALN
jgi:NADP-dependent aldehyde dehydrogenase